MCKCDNTDKAAHQTLHDEPQVSNRAHRRSSRLFILQLCPWPRPLPSLASPDHVQPCLSPARTPRGHTSPSKLLASLVSDPISLLHPFPLFLSISLPFPSSLHFPLSYFLLSLLYMFIASVLHVSHFSYLVNHRNSFMMIYIIFTLSLVNVHF